MDDTRLVTLLTEDCVQVENKIYFIARDINVVCSLDLNTQKVQIVDSIPEEDILASRLGAKIVHWRNELIFAPMKAKKIWLYNLDTKEWHGIKRKEIGDKKENGLMFQAVLHGDKLFVIGSDYPAIICLDLLSEQTTYIESPYNRLKEVKEKIGDIYFRHGYVQRGTRIYMASCLDNYVLEFDMETLKHQWIKVGSEKNRYSGITWDGENFWLAPRTNTPIVKWDGGNVVEEYSLPEGFEQEMTYFLGAVYDNGRIILPRMKNCAIDIVDLEKGKMKLDEKRYSFYHRADNQGIVGQTLDGIMEICDRKSRSVCFKCVIDKKKIAEYFFSKNIHLTERLSQGMHRENSVIGIMDTCMDDAKISSNRIEVRKESQGKRIWKNLRNL